MDPSSRKTPINLLRNATRRYSARAQSQLPPMGNANRRRNETNNQRQNKNHQKRRRIPHTSQSQTQSNIPNQIKSNRPLLRKNQIQNQNRKITTSLSRSSHPKITLSSSFIVKISASGSYFNTISIFHSSFLHTQYLKAHCGQEPQFSY